VELLVVFVGAGVKVRVAVDNLERPLGVLELQLLLLVAVGGNLLLAFPLLGRRAIASWLLLLLLAELLRKLLDILALLCTVAPGVVYRAPWTALIAAEATWATTPTYRSSNNSSSGSSGQRLVVAAGLLLPPVFATALSSGLCIGLAGLP
jgi:hypothetical protein